MNQQQVMHGWMRPAPVADVRRLLPGHFAQHAAQPVLPAPELHGPRIDQKLALARPQLSGHAKTGYLANQWL